MKPDYSDALPEDFYAPDGKVNFSSLVTRQHHTSALAIAERNLYSIEEQVKVLSVTDIESRRKADAAHKFWTWFLARIRQRLAIFNARERNVKLSRSVLIRKYLVHELKKHVPRSVYKECDRIARNLAREEANRIGEGVEENEKNI
ncbi:hypothetical protein F3J34_14005 [Klebsiella sp. Ap-873]|nr:hypothetical protein [Klebsiella sp. Ap-873]